MRAHIPVNLLVAGHLESGKTSFIATLSTFLASQARVEQVSVSDFNTNLRTLAPLKSSNFSRSSRLRLNLIDSPGISLQDNGLSHKEWKNECQEYFDRCNQEYLNEEAKIKRNTRQADKRVHCCIFIIDPLKCLNGLSNFDLDLLAWLSSRVNLILSLGKIDMLTRRMHQKALFNINSSLESAGINTYSFLNDEDSMVPSETMESPVSDTMQDFYTAKVQFSLFNGEWIGDSISMEREYNWGTLCVLKHSDFSLMQQTLLESIDELIEITKSEFYESWRAEKLQERHELSNIISE